MEVLRSKIGEGFLLWFEGFREACCLHRVFILCRRSRKLLIRTGQCFLLNGLIFLGSIFVLKSVVIPTLQWILPDHCSPLGFQEPCPFGGIFKVYSFLRHGLVQLFYLHPLDSGIQCPGKLCYCTEREYFHVLWFYPLYVFSFILSNIWYNDIAKYGFAAMGRHEPTVPEPLRKKDTLQSPAHIDKRAGLGGIVIGIGEQVYSVLLLSFFFLEVYATGFIPYFGKALNFVLLSWMYAYYCFEYKWNFSELSLDKRLDFFESNWAFFAGFGNPCVLAIFFFSPLVSYGVMAILFPLFVLTATGSEAEHVIDSRRKKGKSAGSRRLPIFYAADTLSLRVLSLISLKSQEQTQSSKVL